MALVLIKAMELIKGISHLHVHPLMKLLLEQQVALAALLALAALATGAPTGAVINMKRYPTMSMQHCHSAWLHETKKSHPAPLVVIGYFSQEEIIVGAARPKGLGVAMTSVQ